MNIPDKLIGFNVFDEGERRLGVADIELPSIEHMTETLSGAGIAGEMDTPTLGQLSSMTTTLNFRTINSSIGGFLEPRGRILDCRGAMQIYESGTGGLKSVPARVTMNIIPKTTSLGSFTVGSSTDSSVEAEVTYLKIYVDGKEILEVDKSNYIYKVNGIDYLEDVRSHIGM